jgi:hypothetical protein
LESNQNQIFNLIYFIFFLFPRKLALNQMSNPDKHVGDEAGRLEDELNKLVDKAHHGDQKGTDEQGGKVAKATDKCIFSLFYFVCLLLVLFVVLLLLVCLHNGNKRELTNKEESGKGNG